MINSLSGNAPDPRRYAETVTPASSRRISSFRRLFHRLDCIGNQRTYKNATADCGFQTCLQLGSIEPEDNDVHTLPGSFDCRNKRRDAIGGLCQEFQALMLRQLSEPAWSIVHSRFYATSPTL